MIFQYIKQAAFFPRWRESGFLLREFLPSSATTKKHYAQDMFLMTVNNVLWVSVFDQS